jgi:hypothetical protein
MKNEHKVRYHEESSLPKNLLATIALALIIAELLYLL